VARAAFPPDCSGFANASPSVSPWRQTFRASSLVPRLGLSFLQEASEIVSALFGLALIVLHFAPAWAFERRSYGLNFFFIARRTRAAFRRRLTLLPRKQRHSFRVALCVGVGECF